MTNEKCFEVHAELVVRPTGQDVDDIMVSALEGGICYWCDRVTVEGQYLGKYASEQISRGGTLKVHVTEPSRTPSGTSWTSKSSYRDSGSGWRTAGTATEL